MTGQAFIVKPQSEWIAQAKRCNDAMEKCGAKDMNDFAEKDHDNFALLIEAFVALGVSISDDLRYKARLQSVNSLLGLPEPEWEGE